MKVRAVVLMVVLGACSSKGAEPASQPAPAPAPAPAPVAAIAPPVDAGIDAFESGVDFVLEPAEEGKMGRASEGRAGEGRTGDGRALVASMSDEDLAAAQALIGPDAGKRLTELMERQKEEAKHRPPSLTPAEINKVVKSRAGLYRACYDKELEKQPTLAGKIVMSFTITAEGTVKDTAIDPDRSTLLDEHVGTCLRNQFARLRFPAKGISKVNYPLIFSQQ